MCQPNLRSAMIIHLTDWIENLRVECCMKMKNYV